MAVSTSEVACCAVDTRIAAELLIVKESDILGIVDGAAAKPSRKAA